MNQNEARARVMSALARFETKRRNAAQSEENTMAMRPVKKQFTKTISLNEENPRIAGYYCGFREIEVRGQDEIYTSQIHEFKNKKDLSWFSVWGFTSLNNQLEEVKPGTYTEAIYEGLQKNPKTKRKYHACTVSIDPDDTIPTDKGDQGEFPL